MYSFADEYPFRLEFFDLEIESIRTFNINSQLSINTKNKITIIPNTEAKKSNSSHVSIVNYLPKNTVIWAEDIKYTQGKLNDYYNKAINQYRHSTNDKTEDLNPVYLFTNGTDFTKEIQKFSIIENNERCFFKQVENIYIYTKSCNKKINKNFDLLRADLKRNKEKGLKNIILCSSSEQEERFNAIFENSKKEINYKCILFSLHTGFIDYSNKQAIYTDHQIFDRHHKFKSKQNSQISKQLQSNN